MTSAEKQRKIARLERCYRGKERLKEAVSKAQQQWLSQLPQIGRLLEEPGVVQLLKETPRTLVLRALRAEVDFLRQQILSGDFPLEAPLLPAEIASRAALRLTRERQPNLRRVINATGVVIHTNLGRSPLARRAVARVLSIVGGYSNLEYDLEKRRRGKRNRPIEERLRRLSGAEAVFVVNNNAAAVLLAVGTLAPQREVIVSRGEQVEIGGSFRIPEVMKTAGSLLREVGTTNRTHLRDYEEAIGEETALLLKVHRSNYTLGGFTKEVELPELVALGKRHHLPVMIDLGSGCFVDLSAYGLPPEPVVAEVVRTGVDLVTFSGDKLLGGPQAGILAGGKEIIELLARQPMARALRVDKFTLSALEATLQIYEEGPQQAIEEIPTLACILRPLDEIRKVSQELIERLADQKVLSLEQVEGFSAIGGGSLPEVTVPTVRLHLRHRQRSAVDLEESLRLRPLPVIGLLEKDALALDLRTVLADDLPPLEIALRQEAEKSPPVSPC